MDIIYTHRFITSLVFTALLETLVLYLIVRFVFKKKDYELGLGKIFFTGICASALTIPYVWFVFPFIMSWSRETSLIFSEAFAFLMEAIIYRVFLGLSMKEALLASLLCNASSYYLGPILRTYGLWIYW